MSPSAFLKPFIQMSCGLSQGLYPRRLDSEYKKWETCAHHCSSSIKQVGWLRFTNVCTGPGGCCDP